ncbi:MAG TPA: substrate-binding domain-containing protein [Longimicrobiales bacterium]|nr:substrate-binding domain-containing protein [Longimicrobiales bacterium]
MRTTLLWATLGAATLAGCAAPGHERERVLLVTTTSVEASGLLDALLEAYHAAQDRYRLAPTAVGSGAALRMGRGGDADLLLTHDPEGERRFAAEGHAAEQGPIMMNQFQVVGPAADPARIADADGPVEAFRRIAAAGATFLSRGDDSGTHTRERALWRAAGLAPWDGRPGWYVEAGTGMAETLQMASQLGSYALTDRGTFLHLQASLRLRALVERGPDLENHYTYTLPRRPSNPEGARDLLRWLRGPGQIVIARYGVRRFGEPLFVPTARGG